MFVICIVRAINRDARARSDIYRYTLLPYSSIRKWKMLTTWSLGSSSPGGRSSVGCEPVASRTSPRNLTSSACPTTPATGSDITCSWKLNTTAHIPQRYTFKFINGKHFYSTLHTKCSIIERYKSSYCCLRQFTSSRHDFLTQIFLDWYLFIHIFFKTMF